ncbi:MAG: cytochrome P450 [Candidatus Sulfotelmatobacter sp.]
MSSSTTISPSVENRDAALSLYHLLEPEVLANPYPLFRALRSEDPVHWDPFLHAWAVTRYPDVLEVLLNFSADRTPTPVQLDEMGLSELNPIARVMVKQMLFLDAPAHTRLRSLSAKAFTPARVEELRGHIKDIVNHLLDGIQPKGAMDVIADLAEPLPAIVTAEMLGVPTKDHLQLKDWSADFAEMLGNFQHNPERYPRVLKAVANLTEYFQNAIREQREHPRPGLINALMTAEIDGDRLTEEEVIANCIVTMVGGQETTTNLIGNGLLTLLRNPGELKKLRDDASLIPSAVEEMLRYESPSQHTARMCPSDREMGGKLIKKRQAVIAVMAAANRDPERFPEPDRFDISRKDNRHLAFGYAAHYCFGAPLARVEGQVVFEALLRRLTDITLDPEPIEWRSNLGLRGLKALNVVFGEAQQDRKTVSGRQREQRPPLAFDAAPAKVTQDAETRNRLLAKYLSSRAGQASPSEAKISKRPAGTVIPLSLSQEEIVRHETRVPGTWPLYNECINLSMDGPLDVAVLERSFAEILRRHEIWRSTFESVNGQFVQVVHPAAHVKFPVLDLSSLAPADREAEVERHVGALARLPFQLQRGPMLRPTLVRFDDTHHRLYVVAHQIVLDGMSVYQIFPTELAALYRAFSSGKPSPLTELQFQYDDFAHWQREWVSSEGSKQIGYWRKQLDGKVLPLSWPGDAGRPLGETFKGALQLFTLPQALGRNLKKTSHQENSTLFLTLLSAFAILLRRYTDQEDLVVGTLSPSGRKRAEFQGLLGHFLNPVALRLNLKNDPTFRELVAQAREVMCGAMGNDDVPVETVARELVAGGRAGENPFFKVAISMQPPMPKLDVPWRVTTMDIDSGGSPWNFYLAFVEQDDQILGRAQYNPALLDAASVTRTIQDFQSILEASIDNPGRRMSQLDSMELSGAPRLSTAVCPFSPSANLI